MRVMITGASGFVGSALLRRILATRSTEAILAIGSGRAGSLPGVRHLSVDVRLPDFAQALADFKPTHIFHLAARSSVADAERERIATMDVAALGSINLADAVRQHAPEAKVLLASSGEVYGRAFLSVSTLNEESPVLPGSAYARSKLAAELLLTDRLGDKAKLVIMRPLNHTGAGQDSRFVLPTFALQIAEIEAGLRQPTIQVGNLEAERDFMNVIDVVDAYIVSMMDSPRLEAVETFNVASEQLRSIRSILNDLMLASGVECSIVVDVARLRPVDVPQTRLSSARIRNQTGWAPKTSWETTISEVLAHARQQVMQRP